jgi:hypothetical protein
MFNTTVQLIHAATGQRIATISNDRDHIRDDMERILASWFDVPASQVEFAETVDGDEVAMFGPVTLAFIRQPAPEPVAPASMLQQQAAEVPALLALIIFVAFVAVAAAVIASRGM